MGRRMGEEHLIGDPVDPPVERGCIKTFTQYNRTKDYLKRTLVILFVAIIISMMISLMFILLIDREGMKFVLPIFLFAMVLIICISLPIGLKMGLKLMEKMNNNRVDVFQDHILLSILHKAEKSKFCALHLEGTSLQDLSIGDSQVVIDS